MNISDKKLREFSAQLSSGDPLVVLNTIEILRNEDPFLGAIKLLAEVYDRTENSEIRSGISEFMNDMKESTARLEVIKEINKLYKQATIRMLVSSCWQSGLDYSPYAADFAVAFNKGDYPTAIECFTVIEEASQYLSMEERSHVISILMENEPVNSSEKSALVSELIKMLE